MSEEISLAEMRQIAANAQRLAEETGAHDLSSPVIKRFDFFWSPANCVEVVDRLSRRFVAAEAAISRVRALHKPFGIYDECGHDHKQGDPGVVWTGDDYSCTHLYDICTECCAPTYERTGECAEAHDHGPGKPICATIAALDGPEENA